MQIFLIIRSFIFQIAGPAFMPPLNCPSKDCVENRANGRLQMQIRGSKFMKFQEMRIQELVCFVMPISQNF